MPRAGAGMKVTVTWLVNRVDMAAPKVEMEVRYGAAVHDAAGPDGGFA